MTDLMHIEGVALDVIAERFGTPTYVYSRAALNAAARSFLDAFAQRPALICYAVKANGNLAILSEFARLGCGFDIVSGGELARVLVAGGDPKKIVFSGVGKTAAEMTAALNAGILCFNIESISELELLSATAAKMNTTAPVSFRINPDVDAKTHPYISTGLKENKFGIPISEARAAYQRARALPAIRVIGIDMHIGSQLTDVAPVREAAIKLRQLVELLAADGVQLHHIDVGGGIGVTYHDETVPPVADWAKVYCDVFADRPEILILEPGRRMVAASGWLLTRVVHLKPGTPNSFAIVDAAMNDLLRPALYEAWHPITPVMRNNSNEERLWNIVGPVCETSDFLGKERRLALQQNDLLAVGVAGAYGFSMSSNYNARPRACEVMVDGDQVHVIRQRENPESLWSLEQIIA